VPPDELATLIRDIDLERRASLSDLNSARMGEVTDLIAERSWLVDGLSAPACLNI